MKRYFLNQLILVLLVVTITTFTSRADVKLPRIFTSNIVLQKGMENTIWGWADKNENISISLNGKKVKTKAGKDGKWSAKLPVMDYGGPYTLLVKGNNSIELTNVMIGEVWICSGQSNMEFPVSVTENAKEEIANANYPDIRLFTVPKKIAQRPADDLENGEWAVCTSKTIPGFSAVGYFFARELYQKLKVPIGVIKSAWGGTVAETWISLQTIENDPDFATKLIQMKSSNIMDEQEQFQTRIKQLFGDNIPKEDIGIVNGNPVWIALDLDDSKWETIKVPQFWEEQGYANFDGIAYYRCEINLTDRQSQKNAILHLGKVDDSDMTWMNGNEIGKTEHESSKDRIYTIDAKFLRPGKNMLVVRVDDKGGKGGIWGNSENLFLLVGNEKINLSGEWKFRFGKPVVIPNFLPNKYPTLLFNSMINPIVLYGIKGVIWYQGESNTDRTAQYRHLFPSLITDWRNHWKLGDFSFLWVQLANFMKPVQQPSESNWAELREAQTMTLKLPNTGMASAIDIGDANDIHPKDKQDVGLRLALNALKITYGKNLVNQGPMYSSAEFKDGKAFILFTNTGSGLMVKDHYGYLKGFAIAGADKKFHWAQARITGNNKVEVFCEEVPDPSAVRYGWADNPEDINLYNKEGLPANPFRTDY